MPTLGVAITIPRPWSTHLSWVREAAGDPLALAIPPHVTLLPPTVVAGADMAAFLDHVSAVANAYAPFTMALSGSASFRPVSPVVFVQVSEGISSCEQIERALRAGPVARSLEFNYHPHVTVAHHVPDPALDEAAQRCAGFRADFEVTGFGLHEQGDDGAWRHRRQYPLSGAPRG